MRNTVLACVFFSAGCAYGQTTAEFEVASIKLNTPDEPVVDTNVPLGPGNVFTPTGGYFQRGELSNLRLHRIRLSDYR